MLDRYVTYMTETYPFLLLTISPHWLFSIESFEIMQHNFSVVAFSISTNFIAILNLVHWFIGNLPKV